MRVTPSVAVTHCWLLIVGLPLPAVPISRATSEVQAPSPCSLPWPASRYHFANRSLGGGVNLVVHAATDRKSGREVVVKRLPSTRKAPLHPHLQNELELLALLDHGASNAPAEPALDAPAEPGGHRAIVLPTACYHDNGTLVAVYEKYAGDLSWLRDGTNTFTHTQRDAQFHGRTVHLKRHSRSSGAGAGVGAAGLTPQSRRVARCVDISIMTQVASGLRILGDAGIVHRDLHAKNILWRGSTNFDVEVAITDFGWSCSPLSCAPPAATTGRKAYTAPEANSKVLLRSSQERPVYWATPASDVYSLATVYLARVCQEEDVSRFFGKKAAAYGTLAHSLLLAYNGKKGTYDGVVSEPANRTAPKSEAAERAQQEFLAVIERECPRAFGESAAPSAVPGTVGGSGELSGESADMTYLRTMLDLDWWRRPSARAVEAFYRGLARGCTVGNR